MNCARDHAPNMHAPCTNNGRYNRLGERRTGDNIVAGRFRVTATFHRLNTDHNITLNIFLCGRASSCGCRTIRTRTHEKHLLNDYVVRRRDCARACFQCRQVTPRATSQQNRDRKQGARTCVCITIQSLPSFASARATQSIVLVRLLCRATTTSTTKRVKNSRSMRHIRSDVHTRYSWWYFRGFFDAKHNKRTRFSTKHITLMTKISFGTVVEFHVSSMNSVHRDQRTACTGRAWF